MKHLITLVAATFILSLSFQSIASGPVEVSSNSDATVPELNIKKGPELAPQKKKEHQEQSEKNDAKTNLKSKKKVEKINTESNTKKTKGDDTTVAIILALVSVLLFPFGLHNWYLGRKKQALWQTLLVFPGFILIIPAVISWVWQVVDLITLLVNGDLP